MATDGIVALDRRQDITLIKAGARAFRRRRMPGSGRGGSSPLHLPKDYRYAPRKEGELLVRRGALARGEESG